MTEDMTEDSFTSPADTPEMHDAAEAPEAPAFEGLPDAALTVDLIANAIFFAVAVLAASVVWIGIGVGNGMASMSSLIALAAAAILLALLALRCFYLTLLQHRRYLFKVNEDGLTIHRGVLWRSRIFIPRSRIQHTDVSQGPLQRKLELGKLTVHTAGTQNASTSIEGLEHTRALQLRDQLTHDSDGVDGV